MTVEPGSTAGSTIAAMGVVKKSVSLPEDVAETVAQYAREEGTTVSGWLSELAAHEIRIREGLKAVEEWEAENGPFTEEETQEGQRILRELLNGARNSSEAHTGRGHSGTDEVKKDAA